MFDETDMETSNPLFALYMLKARIADDIAAKTDPRKKEVGDRVIIWDGSYSQAVSNPNTHYFGIDLEDHKCIITATDQYHQVESIIPGKLHNLDVIVYSPKFDCQIRTKSEFIRIVD